MQAVYERDRLIEDLRHFVVEFTLKDGVMFRATLKPEMLPDQYKDEKHIDEEFHNTNQNMLLCYGVRQKKYFTVDMNNVMYVQVIDGY